MGLSSEEIEKIQKGVSVEALLIKKKADLLKKIAEETMKLSQVEYYLQNKNEVGDYK